MSTADTSFCLFDADLKGKKFFLVHFKIDFSIRFNILDSLKTVVSKYLCPRAAILLFAKNPQQYYIQSHSKIGRFLSETDIQSSDIVEGNLINQVDMILDILRLKYLIFFSHKDL